MSCRGRLGASFLYWVLLGCSDSIGRRTDRSDILETGVKLYLTV